MHGKGFEAKKMTTFWHMSFFYQIQFTVFYPTEGWVSRICLFASLSTRKASWSSPTACPSASSLQGSEADM